MLLGLPFFYELFVWVPNFKPHQLPLFYNNKKVFFNFTLVANNNNNIGFQKKNNIEHQKEGQLSENREILGVMTLDEYFGFFFLSYGTSLEFELSCTYDFIMLRRVLFILKILIINFFSFKK